MFLGSKQYPYKGVLDQLANRAGSNGTNAWTANDHTAYTISTAGSEGFLKMLPVYVDHILHPTITDAGFVTEVYHINGAGEDAGVVYSEMQARENTAGDLMALEYVPPFDWCMTIIDKPFQRPKILISSWLCLQERDWRFDAQTEGPNGPTE